MGPDKEKRLKDLYENSDLTLVTLAKRFNMTYSGIYKKAKSLGWIRKLKPNDWR